MIQIIEVKGRKYRCQIDFSVNVIRGKWKVDIICYLKDRKVLRYGELMRLIPKITHKILAQQLSELEFFGIITKTIYPEVPPKVEYRLTEAGLELSQIFDSLIQWADNYYITNLNNSKTELVN